MALFLPLAVATGQSPQGLRVADGQQPKTISRRVGVGGNVVNAAVDNVRSALEWHAKLGPALRTARAQGKPLLWIQALGDLDGFL